MVCVFPVPVWPYANTVLSYPASTSPMTGARVWSNTSFCVEKEVKTSSNAKVLRNVRAPLPLITVTSFFSVEAVTTGSVLPLSSRSDMGRSRTTTWMPERSVMVAFAL